MEATIGTTIEAMATTMDAMNTTMEVMESTMVTSIDAMGATTEPTDIMKRVRPSWVTVVSVVASDLAALVLASYFATVLPTKRNLLTKLDTLLVLGLTITSNVWVSRTVS